MKKFIFILILNNFFHYQTKTVVMPPGGPEVEHDLKQVALDEYKSFTKNYRTLFKDIIMQLDKENNAQTQVAKKVINSFVDKLHQLNKDQEQILFIYKELPKKQVKEI